MALWPKMPDRWMILQPAAGQAPPQSRGRETFLPRSHNRRCLPSMEKSCWCSGDCLKRSINCHLRSNRRACQPYRIIPERRSVSRPTYGHAGHDGNAIIDSCFSGARAGILANTIIFLQSLSKKRTRRDAKKGLDRATSVSAV